MNSTSVTLIEKLSDPSDQLAWRQFATIYLPVIDSWLRTMGLGQSDVEDVSQEIAVKVYGAFQKGFCYDPQKSFRAWLYTLSRRLALNACKKKQRDEEIVKVKAKLELADPNDPVGAFEQREFAQIVCAQLLELIRHEVQETTFQAFELNVLNGLPTKEVAERLGMTRNAVVKARHRVMSRLRAESEAFLT